MFSFGFRIPLAVLINRWRSSTRWGNLSIWRFLLFLLNLEKNLGIQLSPCFDSRRRFYKGCSAVVWWSRARTILASLLLPSWFLVFISQSFRFQSNTGIPFPNRKKQLVSVFFLRVLLWLLFLSFLFVVQESTSHSGCKDRSRSRIQWSKAPNFSLPLWILTVFSTVRFSLTLRSRLTNKLRSISKSPLTFLACGKSVLYNRIYDVFLYYYGRMLLCSFSA